jgi:hypothetical protein
MSKKAKKWIQVFLFALQLLAITKFRIGMELEQHRCGVIQSVISGPRRPGFKTTTANKLRDLNTGYFFTIHFKFQ